MRNLLDGPGEVCDVSITVNATTREERVNETDRLCFTIRPEDDYFFDPSLASYQARAMLRPTPVDPVRGVV